MACLHLPGCVWSSHYSDWLWCQGWLWSHWRHGTGDVNHWFENQRQTGRWDDGFHLKHIMPMFLLSLSIVSCFAGFAVTDVRWRLWLTQWRDSLRLVSYLARDGLFSTDFQLYWCRLLIKVYTVMWYIHHFLWLFQKKKQTCVMNICNFKLVLITIKLTHPERLLQALIKLYN